MRKTSIVITVILCMVFSTIPAWANTVESVQLEKETETPYVYANWITLNFAISGGNAVCIAEMPVKLGQSIEYAQINAYIKKSSGTTVKSFSQKVYPKGGEIAWKDSHKLTSKGTYYLHVVIKCYKSGKVVETITKDSTNKRY